MKKILILCTGNSCRSIIAEALINAKLKGVEAQSAGVKANGRVNPNAKLLLEEKGIWKEHYHSKTIEQFTKKSFDLLVTVCDHAKETCPIFPKPVEKLHKSFPDPEGKPYEDFLKTYKDIEHKLLPEIKKTLFR